MILLVPILCKINGKLLSESERGVLSVFESYQKEIPRNFFGKNDFLFEFEKEST